ncbi:MAG TPA: hypothetical protein VJ385_04775 [Fibrobacteria bacterium]|nr:hypothetical protein [Fibrobacteria bacterium]
MITSAGAQNALYGTGVGTLGSDNARYGYEAGKAAISSSSLNTLFGSSVGRNFTGSEAVLFGQNAGKDQSGQYAAFFGQQAGKVNTGERNTFVGNNSGPVNTSGSWNTFVGSASGALNTSGGSNTFFGYRTGGSNTTGNQNVFFGADAGGSSQTGSRNIFMGHAAGLGSSASDNVCLGRETCAAGAQGSGYERVYVGYRAGKASTTEDNLMVGSEAGLNRQNGYDNTFIGYRAGYTATGNEGNVFVGANAGYSELGYEKFYVANSTAGTPLMRGDFSAGWVEIKSYTANQGCDLAEHFEVVDGPARVRPGMLVSISAEQDGKMRVASSAYDPAVAGVISGAGGVSPGVSFRPRRSPGKAKTYPIALAGRVYCLADASRGAIRPGDLLTSSDVPGHAMKAVDRRRAGRAMVGKALSSLERGRGLVLALIGD